MSSRGQGSRRSFLRSAALGASGSSVVSRLAGAVADGAAPAEAAGPNDRVRIATVGMGIIGFIDTECALKIPGVELVAAADLYEGRRTHAREVFGNHVATGVDYREILERQDVDAVLVCVPDHWHARIAVDAMNAGKAVYCEKPMVRLVDEGPGVIAAQKRTGAVFQVGSQYASSVLYDKARDLIRRGAVGRVNAVEARYNRNSALGAWQYSLPVDASPKTVDWDRFLGDAPKRPFDATRFFRWRNYWDYGTAVAGDLFVHLLTGIHHATGSTGPTRVAAMGGQRYWKDGRDVYDVIMGLLDYPETAAHPGFTLALQTDFEDGGGGGSMFRFIGDEGVISVGNDTLTLSGPGIVPPTADQVLKGYNSARTFSVAGQAALAERYLAEHPATADAGKKARTPETFTVPEGYDPRLDHFRNFFRSVRERTPVYEDAVFGFRAAAPALLCNDSYRQGKVIGWDPQTMTVAG